MSDMECPFCQQELVEIQFGEQRYWTCINDRCDKSVGLGGNKKLWQELIRTRKALDIAVDALKKIKRSHNTESFYRATAELALEQIESITKGENNE